MKRKVLDFVEKHNMLNAGDGVAVGVSGGADSMSLLLFLMSVKEQLGLKLVAVHINHGIRGAEADRDEEFVRSFCEKNGVSFRAVHADIPALAREKGLTEEEAGRNFRYETFFKVCREEGLNRIAVAHNRDDNAETVLFNIFRGSGLQGICGIPPVREKDGITVIRPLLSVTRKEIEEYVEAAGTGFCTDSTNKGEDYSRNRIRNRLLPYIKENINSGAAEHLAGLSERISGVEHFVESETAKRISYLTANGLLEVTEADGRVSTVKVDASYLSGEDPFMASTLLRRFLGMLSGSMKDIETRHTDSLLALAGLGTGKSVDLPYGITARTSYGKLILERERSDKGRGCREAGSGKDVSLKQGSDKASGNASENTSAKAPENTSVKAPENTSVNAPGNTLVKTLENISVTVPGRVSPDGGSTELSFEIIGFSENLSIPKNDYTKWFDYAKIHDGLCVRHRRTGDYLLIRSGKEGALCKKSVKDHLIDAKVDRKQRDSLWMVAEGSHVLWIAGLRRDDSYPVTKETEQILEINYLHNGGSYE